MKSVTGEGSSEQFCINFSDGSGGYISCDWRRVNDVPVWTMSDREYGEVQWFNGKDLNEEGRKEILKRFGLESLADELPLDILRFASPKLLLQMRRVVEADNSKLERLNPVSDRMGGHIPAELAA